MEDISSRLTNLVSKHPKQSILIAFFVGVIFGILLSILFYGQTDRDNECQEVVNVAEDVKEGTGEDRVEGVSVEKVDRVVEISHTEDIIEEKEVCVDIEGAVKKPGVYCLPEDSRLVDILEKSGGFISDRYAYKYVSQRMNFAKKIFDEGKVYIPFDEDVVCDIVDPNNDPSTNDNFYDTSQDNDQNAGGQDEDIFDDFDDTDVSDQDNSSQEGSDNAQCIDINSATKDELMTISGVGEVTAQNIIGSRPFTISEDLLDVSGIGDSKYQQILPFICEL